MNKLITSFDVFSLFYNAKLICRSGKNINLNKPVHFLIYDRTKEYLRIKYKKVWNEIENGFYTFDQLKLYILYEYLFNKSFGIININKEEIKNIQEVFSEKRFKTDKEILKSIKEEYKLKNIKSLFDSTEEGESVAYDLTKKKILSPMIFINCIDKLKDDNKNKEYIRFKNVIRIIKQELNNKKD